MDKTYRLSVNNNASFTVSDSEINALDVIETQLSHYHILKDRQPFTAVIVHSDFQKKTYTVKVNGNLYQVAIASSLDHLIKDMGFTVGASKQINSIKAPMPGLILQISVSVGQEVQENECLLILEAMKMENSFLSPRAGIIKSIAAKKGDAVEKGQLLIEFE